MGALLAPAVFQNGKWYIVSATPPDRNIPSKMPPPGNPGAVGFWAATGTWTYGGKGFMTCKHWCWCPLPVGQLVIVYGPGGIAVPTVSIGTPGMGLYASAMYKGKIINNVALADGPWPGLASPTNPFAARGGIGFSKGSVAPGMAYPPGLPTTPNAPPSGWSGGSWAVPHGGEPWVYDNGQLSSGSNTGLIVALLGAAGAGVAAFTL